MTGPRASRRLPPTAFAIAWFAAALFVAAPIAAQPAGDGGAPAQAVATAAEDRGAPAVPEVGEPPGLGALAGRPIARVEVVLEGDRWIQPAQVRSVRPGEPLSLEAARRASRELLGTGAFASARAEAELAGDAVVLRVRAVPRRVVAAVRVEGGVLDDEGMAREARVEPGAELTSASLPEAARRARAFYARHGYPAATVVVDTRDTDDPLRVVALARVDPGPPDRVVRRIFVHDGPPLAADPALDAELGRVEDGYGAVAGDRADDEALGRADRALEADLRDHAYFRAAVAHQLVAHRGATFLFVRIRPGPKIVARWEGLRAFDAAQLDDAIDIVREPDRSPSHLADKARDFYVRRGFFDVEVRAEERGGPADRIHVFAFDVRENARVRVVARQFPCLGAGPFTPERLGDEIDGLLQEELPGGGLFGPVDPRDVDALLGPREGAGTRPVPLDLDPFATYAPDVYDRALEHVRDLLRSEGYLSATVGPAVVVRRACDRRSPAGACVPVPLPVPPRARCAFDARGVPEDEPPADPRLSCRPDPARGISCDPRLLVLVPIKLGPRTFVWDVAVEGNRALGDPALLEAAAIDLGDPLSQARLDAARRRIVDAYREEGFAFAEVRAATDLSADRSRARARFVVAEGERVFVDGIIVRGARRTEEALVRRRVALAVGKPYRASDVRKTEERIATLGVFSSVSVSLEDPHIPARRKTVVVEVQELLPQYLDVKPGFSTGEGVRASFEYGHRNVAGSAIQLVLRVQLSYLPDPFILDPAVRENFRKLTVGERLERRNTASIVFPEIGLGPLIRLGLEGIDVRHNARDFGLNKEAAVATLTYRPARAFWAQVGHSTELNDVKIFTGQKLDDFLAGAGSDLRRLLRVPEGETVALAPRVAATWDRRDNPFGATRGTLLVGAAEFVHAFPARDNPNTITSDFLRLTGTTAGYVRLSKRGLALAVFLRAGRNIQLVADSKTYPDRLFFLGGVDTLRGFLQDTLVPQDVADKIVYPCPAIPTPEQLCIGAVAVRGGDLFVNPRTELRIPLPGAFQTVVFLDTGNVWVDPRAFEPYRLRYASGSGLRVETPIGPVALDYGVNLVRRPWEDFGAFHFSIGLF